MLKLSDFDYTLPKELIAQYPLGERDSSRLMVLDRKEDKIEHRYFKDIVDYLNQDDTVVLNDSKVLRARLQGLRKTGGKAEVLLIRHKDGNNFEAMIRPGRLKLGEKIIFGGAGLCGVITAKDEIAFNVKNINSIYELGVIPLPPYIKRAPEDLDDIYYQTVYANKEGSIASPTAGLHFTSRLLRELKLRGINLAYITLHVGKATFKPIKTQDITQHEMGYEAFEIQDEAISLIKNPRADKARLIAVGTTTLRALEAFAGSGVKSGQTNLFIYPGYKFSTAQCLLTNFHLPRTTLFMLVCAFAGEKLVKKAYQEAIDRKYRFYSYGDAMLII